VHKHPEQTLQAFRDVRARVLLPIHNGAVELALHPRQEPFERLAALADAASLPLSTPSLGERVDMAAPQRGSAW
jgi:L-ascorbate metabolism protein UlaG (beta-lactamase superfamily)